MKQWCALYVYILIHLIVENTQLLIQIYFLSVLDVDKWLNVVSVCVCVHVLFFGTLIYIILLIWSSTLSHLKKAVVLNIIQEDISVAFTGSQEAHLYSVTMPHWHHTHSVSNIINPGLGYWHSRGHSYDRSRPVCYLGFPCTTTFYICLKK